MVGRIKIFFFLFGIIFLLIVGKLFYWQIFSGKKLTVQASAQHDAWREVPASRGEIFSRDEFPLVLNQKSYLLYGNPKKLKITQKELLKKLEFVPDIGQRLTFLENKTLNWVILAKKLVPEVKNKIEQLSIEGLGIEDQAARFYPEASMSAHLLGFVGENDNGEEQGYFGLEGYYNKELAGKPGKRFFEQDALGRPIPLSAGQEEKSIPGRDLVLNLDRTLQFIAERRLKSGIEKYGAVSGLLAIMNPKNGQVLAMASFPSYDPQNFSFYNNDLYRNPVVSSAFEPGSIFKPFVMASAIDAGIVTPQETCNTCAGPRKIADVTIKTWNEKYFPDTTMTNIIVHSDNVGMVYVAQKIGSAKLYSYLNNFGFGKKTKIDLQGEVAPEVKEGKSWSSVDLATTSFGQGIAVTPIQMLSAICAIANKGVFYTPQVVGKIQDGQKVIEIKPIEAGRPIKASTAKTITEMMVKAVEEGEAKWAKPKNYSVAGKTGTAQIPLKGSYDQEKTVASFIGFAPAYDPKFAMLVVLTEPKTSIWASETAAPLWFEIASDIFRLWNIPSGK